MAVKNARLLAGRPNGGARSPSWWESYGPDQPGPLAGSLLERSLAALISLIGALFDNLAGFSQLAAELPPEHRTSLGPEDVARARRLLLSEEKPSE